MICTGRQRPVHIIRRPVRLVRMDKSALRVDTSRQYWTTLGLKVRRYSINWLIRSCLSLGQACQNGSIPTALSALFPRFCMANNSEPLPVSYPLGWGIACPNPPIPSTSLIYVFSIFFPHRDTGGGPWCFPTNVGQALGLPAVCFVERQPVLWITSEQ